MEQIFDFLAAGRGGDSSGDQGDSTGAGVRAHRGAGF